MMYHAQDRHLNVPLTELSGKRGGTDNSLTRISMKPTHLIGGYAQLSFGFNYYGPTRLAARRDGRRAQAPRRRSSTDAGPRPGRDGDEPRQVHRLPHLLGHLQERLDQPARHRVHLVQRRRDEARRRLPEALGGPGALEGRLGARPRGKLRLKAGGRLDKLATLFSNPDLPTLDDYYEPWTYDYETLIDAPAVEAPAGRAARVAGHRRAARPAVGPELGRRPRRRARARAARPEPPRRRRGAGAARVRAGVHVLPPADLRALPEPVVRRLVPLGGDVQARGGRDRARRPGEVPRAGACASAAAPTRRSTSTGAPARPRSARSATRGSRPASRRSARRPASGDPLPRLVLYDADRVRGRASVPDEQDLLDAQLDVFLDPDDPEVREQARRDGIPEDWLDAARRSPVYALADRLPASRCRCTPSTGRCRWSGTCRRSRP